jgi:hypothetical protein
VLSCDGGAALKRVLAWFGANPLRPAITAMIAILVLGSAAKMTDAAQLYRDWYPYLGRTCTLT